MVDDGEEVGRDEASMKALMKRESCQPDNGGLGCRCGKECGS